MVFCFDIKPIVSNFAVDIGNAPLIILTHFFLFLTSLSSSTPDKNVDDVTPLLIGLSGYPMKAGENASNSGCADEMDTWIFEFDQFGSSSDG